MSWRAALTEQNNYLQLGGEKTGLRLSFFWAEEYINGDETKLELRLFYNLCLE